MVGFKVFLQRFTRFLFFLLLLNLDKVGFFGFYFCGWFEGWVYV